MIGGVIMILTAIWVYQTMLKVKKPNLLFWVAGAAGLFFITEFVMQLFCIEIIDALNGKDVGGNYEPGLTDIGDRKTQELAGDNFLMSFICELMPSTVAVFAVAVVRTMFITKEALTIANLFSGVKELFISIKDSFKSTTNG